LRPGGIVAFQEIDMSQLSTVPASDLFDRVGGWIRSAFNAGGAELNMGGKLLATFLRAGFPRPTMIAATRVESGPESPAYDYIARVLRSLMPLVERGNIATEVDTIHERRHRPVIWPSRGVGHGAGSALSARARRLHPDRVQFP
jgi:hypothetical protein